MFDEIIQASFSNTSNLRGDALDGNWAFLLPDLALEKILCVGQISAAALHTLTSLAQSVTQVSTIVEASSQFELIYLAKMPTVADWPAIAQLLTPNGHVYYEDRGLVISSPADSFALRQSLWLTPLLGNMQTAVPLSDRTTITFFQDNGVYSPTITQHTFHDFQRRWRKRKEQPATEKSAEVSAVLSPSSARSGGWKKRVGSALRKSRNIIVSIAPGIERVVAGNRLAESLLARRGNLLAAASAVTPHLLPEYLRQLAMDSGVDLSSFRWGYAARGRYRSQKLLFFLFEPDATKPLYIIKMVRDAVFNSRLEREHQGLLLLQERNLMPDGTLPRIVFFGYHRQLAIVGETVIVGDPFESRSQFSAECRYAKTAIDWLIELSTLTPVKDVSANLADNFQALVDRYVAIYRPSALHHQFLSDQVERIRRQPPALVFQHGDPGSWNLLVTRDDLVAFLDWENATPQGVPLWDLLYFLRSYCIAAGQKSGDHGVLAAFEYLFIENSVLSPLIIDAFQRYCRRARLSPNLVEPLFHLCWVFWAVKQASLVEKIGLGTAHYGQLLKLCIDRRQASTLARIFSL